MSGLFQVFSTLEQIITLHSNGQSGQCIFPTMMFWRADEKLSGLHSVYDDDVVGDFPRRATCEYAHSWRRDIHVACTLKATAKYVFAIETFLQLLREAV